MIQKWQLCPEYEEYKNADFGGSQYCRTNSERNFVGLSNKKWGCACVDGYKRDWKTEKCIPAHKCPFVPTWIGYY